MEDFKSRDVVWPDVLYNVAAVFPDPAKMRLVEFKGEIDTPKPEAKKVGGVNPLLKPGGAAPTGSGFPAAKPGTATAAKPPEKKPAGKLALRVVVAEGSLASDLANALGVDAEFQNPKVDYGTYKKGTQEFTITANVFKRKPSEYSRVITAKLPAEEKKPAPPANPDPAIDTQDQEQP